MADLDLEAIKAMLACLTPYDEQYRLGAIYCAAPTTIAALVAEVERLRVELDDLRSRGVVADADCRCGSGGHPRRCAKHPHRFDMHCRELDEVAELEELREEVKRLRSRLDHAARRADALVAMSDAADETIRVLTKERDEARPSDAVLEALSMAHECLVEAIADGDLVVADNVAVDEAGEWLARMVDRD